MDRFAIFVDAGYFFAAGSQAAFGTPVTRKNLSIQSLEKMLFSLKERARKIADSQELLRMYWYDAMPGHRMSMDQTALALSGGVKLRLGAMNSAGEQKGVDSLIVTDLIELSRNHAITDAIIISGDEDLRIAVQVAQSFGTKVHILAVGDHNLNVSPSLKMEADSLDVLEPSWFREHLCQVQPTVNITVPVDLARSDIPLPTEDKNLIPIATQIIEEFIQRLSPMQIEKLKVHFSTEKGIPPEHDRPLLASISQAFGNKIFDGKERAQIRRLFISSIEQDLSEATLAV